MMEPKPALQKPPGYQDPNTTSTGASPKPPNRKPPLPPAFRQKRKRRSCCCVCCCFLTVLMFSLLIVLTICGVLFYVIFRPQLPVFRLHSVETPAFNVNVKPDGTFFSSQTVVFIQATNPNRKILVSYGRVQARISVDEGVGLGSDHVPGFEQGERNVTVLKFSTQVKHVLVDDGVGGSIEKGFQSKKLNLHVEMDTRFGVTIGEVKLGKIGIRVLCDGVLKNLKGGGNETPKCKINLLNWITLA